MSTTVPRPKVPSGLRDVMKELTREILKKKPADIQEFAENYFLAQLPVKENFAVKGFELASAEYDFSYITNPQSHPISIALVYSIIPEDLTALVKDLIKAVLREQPSNLCEFAVEYFRHLRNANKAEYSKEISYATYDSYFQNKERYLYTPFVKCTCGRTFGEGFGSAYQVNQIASIQDTHNHDVLHKPVSISDLTFETNKDMVRGVSNAYSDEYINSVYVIQRYYRRYVERKRNLKPYVPNENILNEETAALIIQRSLRKLFDRTKSVSSVEPTVPHLQLGHYENDNVSEAASYTSASTAVLSASESGRETHETITAENIVRETIIEGEELENDQQNITICLHADESSVGKNNKKDISLNSSEMTEQNSTLVDGCYEIENQTSMILPGGILVTKSLQDACEDSNEFKRETKHESSTHIEQNDRLGNPGLSEQQNLTVESENIIKLNSDEDEHPMQSSSCTELEIQNEKMVGDALVVDDSHQELGSTISNITMLGKELNNDSLQNFENAIHKREAPNYSSKTYDMHIGTLITYSDTVDQGHKLDNMESNTSKITTKVIDEAAPTTPNSNDCPSDMGVKTATDVGSSIQNNLQPINEIVKLDSLIEPSVTAEYCSKEYSAEGNQETSSGNVVEAAPVLESNKSSAASHSGIQCDPDINVTSGTNNGYEVKPITANATGRDSNKNNDPYDTKGEGLQFSNTENHTDIDSQIQQQIGEHIPNHVSDVFAANPFRNSDNEEDDANTAAILSSRLTDTKEKYEIGELYKKAIKPPANIVLEDSGSAISNQYGIINRNYPLGDILPDKTTQIKLVESANNDEESEEIKTANIKDSTGNGQEKENKLTLETEIYICDCTSETVVTETQTSSSSLPVPGDYPDKDTETTENPKESLGCTANSDNKSKAECAKAHSLFTSLHTLLQITDNAPENDEDFDESYTPSSLQIKIQQIPSNESVENSKQMDTSNTCTASLQVQQNVTTEQNTYGVLSEQKNGDPLTQPMKDTDPENIQGESNNSKTNSKIANQQDSKITTAGEIPPVPYTGYDILNLNPENYIEQESQQFVGINQENCMVNTPGEGMTESQINDESEKSSKIIERLTVTNDGYLYKETSRDKEHVNIEFKQESISGKDKSTEIETQEDRVLQEDTTDNSIAMLKNLHNIYVAGNNFRPTDGETDNEITSMELDNQNNNYLSSGQNIDSDKTCTAAGDSKTLSKKVESKSYRTSSEAVSNGEDKILHLNNYETDRESLSILLEKSVGAEIEKENLKDLVEKYESNEGIALSELRKDSNKQDVEDLQTMNGAVTLSQSMEIEHCENVKFSSEEKINLKNLMSKSNAANETTSTKICDHGTRQHIESGNVDNMKTVTNSETHLTNPLVKTDSENETSSTKQNEMDKINFSLKKEKNELRSTRFEEPGGPDEIKHTDSKSVIDCTELTAHTPSDDANEEPKSGSLVKFVFRSSENENLNDLSVGDLVGNKISITLYEGVKIGHHSVPISVFNGDDHFILKNEVYEPKLKKNEESEVVDDIQLQSCTEIHLKDSVEKNEQDDRILTKDNSPVAKHDCEQKILKNIECVNRCHDEQDDRKISQEISPVANVHSGENMLNKFGNVESSQADDTKLIKGTKDCPKDSLGKDDHVRLSSSYDLFLFPTESSEKSSDSSTNRSEVNNFIVEHVKNNSAGSLIQNSAELEGLRMLDQSGNTKEEVNNVKDNDAVVNELNEYKMNVAPSENDGNIEHLTERLRHQINPSHKESDQNPDGLMTEDFTEITVCKEANVASSGEVAHVNAEPISDSTIDGQVRRVVDEEEATCNIGSKSSDQGIGNQNLPLGKKKNSNDGLVERFSEQLFAETHLRSFWKEHQMNKGIPVGLHPTGIATGNCVLQDSQLKDDCKYIEIGGKKAVSDEGIDRALTQTSMDVYTTDGNQTEAESSAVKKLPKAVEISSTAQGFDAAQVNEDLNLLVSNTDNSVKYDNVSPLKVNVEISNNTHPNKTDHENIEESDEIKKGYVTHISNSNVHFEPLGQYNANKYDHTVTVDTDATITTNVNRERLPRYFNGISPPENLLPKRKLYKEPTAFTIPFENIRNNQKPEVISENIKLPHDSTVVLDQNMVLHNVSTEPQLESESPTKLFRELLDFENDTESFDLDITQVIDDIICLKSNANEMGECDNVESKHPEIDELLHSHVNTLHTIAELNEPDTPRPEEYEYLEGTECDVQLQESGKNSGSTTTKNNSYKYDDFLSENADEGTKPKYGIDILIFTVENEDPCDCIKGGIYEFDKGEKNYECHSPSPQNDNPFNVEAAELIQTTCRKYLIKQQSKNSDLQNSKASHQTLQANPLLESPSEDGNVQNSLACFSDSSVQIIKEDKSLPVNNDQRPIDIGDMTVDESIVALRPEFKLSDTSTKSPYFIGNKPGVNTNMGYGHYSPANSRKSTAVSIIQNAFRKYLKRKSTQKHSGSIAQKEIKAQLQEECTIASHEDIAEADEIPQLFRSISCFGGFGSSQLHEKDAAAIIIQNAFRKYLQSKVDLNSIRSRDKTDVTNSFWSGNLVQTNEADNEMKMSEEKEAAINKMAVRLYLQKNVKHREDETNYQTEHVQINEDALQVNDDRSCDIMEDFNNNECDKGHDKDHANQNRAAKIIVKAFRRYIKKNPKPSQTNVYPKLGVSDNTSTTILPVCVNIPKANATGEIDSLTSPIRLKKYQSLHIDHEVTKYTENSKQHRATVVIRTAFRKYLQKNWDSNKTCNSQENFCSEDNGISAGYNHEENIQGKDAIAIQKAFKKFLQNQRYNQYVPTAPLEEDISNSSNTLCKNVPSEDKSAITIQRAFRNFTARKRLHEIDDAPKEGTEIHIDHVKRPSWFVGDEPIDAKGSLNSSPSEISFEETDAYVELMNSPPYEVDNACSTLELAEISSLTRMLTALTSKSSNSAQLNRNYNLTNISEGSVSAVGSPNNDSESMIAEETNTIVGDETKHKKFLSATSENNEYRNITDQFIAAERQYSDNVNYQSKSQLVFRTLNKRNIDCGLPNEKLDKPCLGKSASITTPENSSCNAAKDSSLSSSENEAEDSLSLKAAKLNVPQEVVGKMQQRRNSTTKMSGNEKLKDYSFEEPSVLPIDHKDTQTDTDEEGIIVTPLQPEDSRESSAQSDVIICGDVNEAAASTMADVPLSTKGSLKRNHSIENNADLKSSLKNVTIDEAIRYIEPPEYEVGCGSFNLDDDTSENIRRKIMAYSLSEADSDGFEKSLHNIGSSGAQIKSQTYDDFNVSTALVDNCDTSTETESTIVSAVTKLQAGARGYLTRKRLGRASAASTGKSTALGDTGKASFGNEAISESLEHLVQEAAAKRIQQVFRQYYRQKVAHEKDPQMVQSDLYQTTSIESSLAQKRSMLQRGDALRDTSTPDEGTSSSNGSDSSKEYAEQQSNLEKTESNHPKLQEKSDAAERPNKIEGNKLKWLSIRQNSMPVQIDSEVFRVIPKHMRKKIKSADGEKGTRKRRILND